MLRAVTVFMMMEVMFYGIMYDVAESLGRSCGA